MPIDIYMYYYYSTSPLTSTQVDTDKQSPYE